jgi:hypothetical protein
VDQQLGRYGSLRLAIPADSRFPTVCPQLIGLRTDHRNEHRVSDRSPMDQENGGSACEACRCLRRSTPSSTWPRIPSSCKREEPLTTSSTPTAWSWESNPNGRALCSSDAINLGCPILFTNVSTAKLTKRVANAFLSTKIFFHQHGGRHLRVSWIGK